MIHFIFTFLFSIILANELIIHKSVLQSKISSLDPALASDTNTQLIINNAWDGLISWVPEEGLTPAIASRWTSKDSIVFVFYITPNLYFQDGSNLNCMNVKLHFDRLRKQPGYHKEQFSIIKNTKCDNDKFIITLKNPYSRFLYILASVAGKIVKIDNNKVIGHGPYEPSIQRDKVLLTKNKYYTNHLSNVDIFEFNIITDENKTLSLAKNDKLHDIALLVLQGNEIHTKQTQWIKQNIWATWAIGLEQNIYPLSIKDVRCEFISKLNDDGFRKEFFPSFLKSQNFIPFGMPGYSENIVNFNKKSLLKEYEFNVYIPSFLKDAKKYQSFFSKKFIDSKLHVNFIIKDFDWIIENYAKGKMGGYLLSLNAEFPDVSFLTSSLKSNSESNFLKIKNPKLDALIKLDESNPNIARNDIYKEINELLSRECATANLMHVTHSIWLQKCVSKLIPSPISEGYFNYRQVVNTCKI